MSLLSLIFLYLILGIMAGIFNSLFGFGGGLFIVPTMYWIMNVTTDLQENYIMKVAITTSLFVMIFNSINSIYRFHKKGKIDWQVGKEYILPISIGVLLTLFAAENLEGSTAKYLFAGYLAMTIALNLRKQFFQPALVPANASSKLYRYCFSIFTGFLSSLLGVGGSVMTVPHFRRQGFSMEKSIALGVMLTLPISLLGFSSYFIAGNNFYIAEPLPYSFGFLYLPAALLLFLGGRIGVPLGIKLIAFLPDHLYAKCYIALLFLFLTLMII